MINKKETYISSEILKKKSFRRPRDMSKAVYSTTVRSKNKKLVNVIKSGLSDLKNEIEEMSVNIIEIEKPDKVADI